MKIAKTYIMMNECIPLNSKEERWIPWRQYNLVEALENFTETILNRDRCSRYKLLVAR